jgi:hypothetical protein
LHDAHFHCHGLPRRRVIIRRPLPALRVQMHLHFLDIVIILVYLLSTVLIG